jgi:hypothetical protein
MKRLSHPLEEALKSRVRLLATTLRPSTVRGYEHTVRLFLRYVREAFPDLRRPCDLRRDPHLPGWLEHLWLRRSHFSARPLSNDSRAAHLIRLRKLFDRLADHAFPPRPGLLLSEDIPRPDQTLPRALPPEDDARLQTEPRSRNDLLSNALLLTRLTPKLTDSPAGDWTWSWRTASPQGRLSMWVGRQFVGCTRSNIYVSDSRCSPLLASLRFW